MTGCRGAPRPSRAAAFLLVALLPLALGIGGPAAGQEASAPPAPRQKPLFPVTVEPPFPEPSVAFDEVRKLLLENYYTDLLADSDLYWAAIKGMLRHVSPPDDPDRSTIWPPVEYERFSESLRGVQNSLGITSTYNRADASLTVTEVLPGSPADGRLRPPDRIMRINGERLGGKSVKEIDALMHGAPGTVVRLTVVRDIEVAELELVIRTFESEDLEVEMLPGNIGYARIRRVSSAIAADLDAAFRAPPLAGAAAVLVDLRGNGGGIFNQGLKLAELFLEKGKPILYALQHGNRIQTIVSQNSTPLVKELVLLIDKGTASSAEIFAGALQAHRRARLVGTPTFGKATVEKTFTLSNDYRVKFIVGALFRPGGKSWQSTGLRPDLAIEQDAKLAGRLEKLPAEQRLAKDAQLRAAWQLLR